VARLKTEEIRFKLAVGKGRCYDNILVEILWEGQFKI